MKKAVNAVAFDACPTDLALRRKSATQQHELAKPQWLPQTAMGQAPRVEFAVFTTLEPESLGCVFRIREKTHVISNLGVGLEILRVLPGLGPSEGDGAVPGVLCKLFFERLRFGLSLGS
jgi:hypothetical protein